MNCIEEEKADKKKNTDSYAGGTSSGMAIENADDIDGVLKQAEAGSQKRSDTGDEERKKPDHEVRVTLYQNGFIVDNDDNLRVYDTPENKEFMAELNKGYIPKELVKKHTSKTLGIALEDKRQSKFIPPPPPAYVAYSGAGTGLGGTAGTGGAVNKDSAEGKPAFDASKPSTKLQIRFHNGERAALDVNLHHTIADIHTFVMCAAPIDGEYTLLTGFPPKPLADPGMTIEAAGLKNAAITQKIL